MGTMAARKSGAREMAARTELCLNLASSRHTLGSVRLGTHAPPRMPVLPVLTGEISAM
jgi:hypothetical protein